MARTRSSSNKSAANLGFEARDNFRKDEAGKKAVVSKALALERVEPLIHEIRGEKVILDSDLARLYGVTTKRLNEQVKRNRERFPNDFMFRLTARESAASRSQFATSSSQTIDPKGGARSRSQIATLKRGQNIKYLPYAFTEHGAIMAANVLNSPRAVQMSVFVVRAFLKMRVFLGDKRELAKQLAAHANLCKVDARC